jgi:acetyltransferase-like isoleucine patch superfamily enzyme
VDKVDVLIACLPAFWRVHVALCTMLTRLVSPGVTIGKGTRFMGMPLLRQFPGSSIALGHRCDVVPRSAYNAIGVDHARVIRTSQPGAVIVIGDDVGMSGCSICAAQAGVFVLKGVSIGKGAVVGAGSVVTRDVPAWSVTAGNPARAVNSSLLDAQVVK